MFETQTITTATVDLKSFVQKAIEDITSAIRDSQETVSKNNYGSHPDVDEAINTNQLIKVNNEYFYVGNINFDVDVSISEASKKGGKGGVNFQAFHINIGGHKNESLCNAAHINFAVPMAIPINQAIQLGNLTIPNLEEVLDKRKKEESYKSNFLTTSGIE